MIRFQDVTAEVETLARALFAAESPAGVVWEAGSGSRKTATIATDAVKDAYRAKARAQIDPTRARPAT